MNKSAIRECNFAMGTNLGKGIAQALVHTLPSTCACGKLFPKIVPKVKLDSSDLYTVSVGKLLEITCEKCQEILPSAVHFRRHSIDKHQKYNHTTKNKESFCCDECGKTFNVSILFPI